MGLRIPFRRFSGALPKEQAAIEQALRWREGRGLEPVRRPIRDVDVSYAGRLDNPEDLTFLAASESFHDVGRAAQALLDRQPLVRFHTASPDYGDDVSLDRITHGVAEITRWPTNTPEDLERAVVQRDRFIQPSEADSRWDAYLQDQGRLEEPWLWDPLDLWKQMHPDPHNRQNPYTAGAVEAAIAETNRDPRLRRPFENALRRLARQSYIDHAWLGDPRKKLVKLLETGNADTLLQRATAMALAERPLREVQPPLPFPQPLPVQQWGGTQPPARVPPYRPRPGRLPRGPHPDLGYEEYF